nr:metal-dependent transcriptional regulator [Cytophagales bacterium]
MYSQAEENYLKALFSLSNFNGEVNVIDLSRELAIKMPTVTSMMKKLAGKNLVHYESYKPLRLTEKGKIEAALIVRKHRLTEMYLVEKMGFGWEEVHEVAEQIEHINSPAFFDKLDQLLGHPKVDPHGSPIPDKQGNMDVMEYRNLGQCEKGDTVKVAAVTNESDEFLMYLNSKEIYLGLEMVILSVDPFDGLIVVCYSGRSPEAISQKVWERLLVEKLEKDPQNRK